MRKKRILPHIVALIAALFIAGLPHGIGILPTDTVAEATEIDGIGATKERVRRGDTFDIVVNVPATNNRADTLEIRIDFDPAAFEVTRWAPSIGSGSALANYDNSRGFAVVVAANSNIDLSRGLVFTATLKAKNYAPTGIQDIRLSRWDVSNTDTGYCWTPAVTSLTLKVVDNLVSVSGKIALAAPDTFSGTATVTLIDSKGNKMSTPVVLTRNYATGKFEGTYQFNEAESDETYTLETVIPGCRTRSDTVTPGSSGLREDVSVNLVGDVDGNGRVGASDATQILRYLVGNTTVIKGPDGIVNEYLLSVARVEGGRNLTTRDATQILRYLAGYSSVFDLNP